MNRRSAATTVVECVAGECAYAATAFSSSTALGNWTHFSIFGVGYIKATRNGSDRVLRVRHISESGRGCKNEKCRADIHTITSPIAGLRF
jgi:hypothetical protein